MTKHLPLMQTSFFLYTIFVGIFIGLGLSFRLTILPSFFGWFVLIVMGLLILYYLKQVLDGNILIDYKDIEKMKRKRKAVSR